MTDCLPQAAFEAALEDLEERPWHIRMYYRLLARFRFLRNPNIKEMCVSALACTSFPNDRIGAPTAQPHASNAHATECMHASVSRAKGIIERVCAIIYTIIVPLQVAFAGDAFNALYAFGYVLDLIVSAVRVQSLRTLIQRGAIEEETTSSRGKKRSTRSIARKQ